MYYRWVGVGVTLRRTSRDGKILYGLNSIVYLDDIGCWSNGMYKEHMNTVQTILKGLAKNNLKTNPLKCE